MKVQDCDGDIWEEDGEGGWEHNSYSLVDFGYFPHLEALERAFGPLTEVTE